MSRRHKWHLLLVVSLLALGLMILGSCTGGQSAPAPKAEQPKVEQAKSAEQAKPAEQAQPVEKPKEQQAASNELDFYKGKTVTFVVATKPGGGYDAYGRLIAPVLQKHLPGSTVIVENVPGAGHIIGANKIYTSKPDGLTFGTFNKGLILSQLAAMEGIQFDLGKMTWLGNAAQEPRVFVVAKTTPYETIDDALKSSEVTLASAGVGSASHTDALLLSKVLNLKVKVAAGYSGQEGDLAMLRGEVQGQIGSWDSMQKMTDNGDARPLLVIGKTRLKQFSNIPTLDEIAPASGKALVALMNTQAQLSRPIAGPPGIPAARAKALQDVFKKVMADPELLAAAEKAKLPIDFMDGEETAAVVKGALDQPKEVIDLVKQLVVEEK